jgi:hypothetical protein
VNKYNQVSGVCLACPGLALKEIIRKCASIRGLWLHTYKRSLKFISSFDGHDSLMLEISENSLHVITVEIKVMNTSKIRHSYKAIFMNRNYFIITIK